MTTNETISLHFAIHRLGVDDYNDTCPEVNCIRDGCKVIPVFMVESSAFNEPDEDGELVEYHVHACGVDLNEFLTTFVSGFVAVTEIA